MPQPLQGKNLCPLCGGTVDLTHRTVGGQFTSVQAKCTACGQTGTAPVLPLTGPGTEGIPPAVHEHARLLDAGHRAAKNIGQA